MMLIFTVIFKTFGSHLLDRWWKVTFETCFTCM